jgi:hypothetical protein
MPSRSAASSPSASPELGRRSEERTSQRNEERHGFAGALPSHQWGAWGARRGPPCNDHSAATAPLLPATGARRRARPARLHPGRPARRHHRGGPDRRDRGVSRPGRRRLARRVPPRQPRPVLRRRRDRLRLPELRDPQLSQRDRRGAREPGMRPDPRPRAARRARGHGQASRRSHRLGALGQWPGQSHACPRHHRAGQRRRSHPWALHHRAARPPARLSHRGGATHRHHAGRRPSAPLLGRRQPLRLTRTPDRPTGSTRRAARQGVFRLAGSKSASAGFVLTATERTVNRTTSLPSTNAS